MKLQIGTNVLFKTSCPADFGDENDIAAKNHGSLAVVTCIAINPEDDDDRDGYFDIQFANGDKMAAVSGFHLERIGGKRPAANVQNSLARILDMEFFGRGDGIHMPPTSSGAIPIVEVKSCNTFEQEHIVTTECGLVLKLANGQQFKITITEL